MKLFLALVSLGFSCGLWAADGATSLVSSVEEMKSKGVTFRRQQLQTPGASVEIETMVASGSSVGRYEFTECVVLKEALSVDRLATLDAAPSDSAPVARRSKSTEAKSVFLIRGKEIASAYFAFEYLLPADSSGAVKVHRYLVPVSAIRRSKTVPLEEAPPTPGV